MLLSLPRSELHSWKEKRGQKFKKTIDVQMVNFCCPQAVWQFWTAVLFSAVEHQTTRREFSLWEFPKSVTVVFRSEGRLRRESAALSRGVQQHSLESAALRVIDVLAYSLESAADSRRRRPSDLQTTVTHVHVRIRVWWSGSGTEVGNGIKSWKAHVLSLAERQEALGGLWFRNKWRTCNFTARFRIWQFQTAP